MGIKGLNTFLSTINNGFNGIETIHLSKLKGKVVVFDLTNQLYRYMHRCQNDKSYVLEFINLINKFQRYGINLIFVFDGAPCEDKQHELTHRRTYREKITNKIIELEQQQEHEKSRIDEYANNDNVNLEGNLSDSACSSDSAVSSNSKLIENLEKKTKTLKTKYIVECKNLFNSMGVPFIHIEDMEADIILNYLVEHNFADMCYSCDTDILAYGCKHVIKTLDFHYDTVQYINYDKLLHYLNISHVQFLYVCILSGTDYNNSLKHSKFEINLKLVKEYCNNNKDIQNIIDNLDKINSTEPDEYKKSLPERFNWQNTLNIYNNTALTETKQIYIQNTIEHFKRYKLQNNTQISNRVINYFNISIKPFDTKEHKYRNKYFETIKLRYNITILQF